MRFKTDIEALILGALAAGPMHGYSIVKALQESSGGLFKLAEGQLYPVLHKMQKEGWIQGEWENPTSGPAKKTYVLQESGKKELQKRRADWKSFTTAVESVLLLSKKGEPEGSNA